MRLAALAFVGLGLWIAPAEATQILACEETDRRFAASFSGEVSGKRAHHVETGAGLFALEPNHFGWSIRIKDEAGLDLSQITPPFHGPNARDIEGWHFRNADNTGPNDGTINAPQDLRLFVFSRNLSGTGGFKPSTDPKEPRLPEFDADGRGWLKVLDFGLADLKKGERARMVYLRYNACLTWAKSEAEIAAEADAKSPDYLPDERAAFAACGLGKEHRLDAYVLPRVLRGDLDGDGGMDLLAPVVRSADGKRGLAVCRSGARLTFLGLDDPIEKAMEPDYLKRVEAWSLKKRSEAKLDEGRTADTDVLVIERIEKSSYTLYWQDEAFRIRHDYRIVEP